MEAFVTQVTVKRDEEKSWFENEVGLMMNVGRRWSGIAEGRSCSLVLARRRLLAFT